MQRTVVGGKKGYHMHSGQLQCGRVLPLFTENRHFMHTQKTFLLVDDLNIIGMDVMDTASNSGLQGQQQPFIMRSCDSRSTACSINQLFIPFPWKSTNLSKMVVPMNPYLTKSWFRGGFTAHSSVYDPTLVCSSGRGARAISFLDRYAILPQTEGEPTLQVHDFPFTTWKNHKQLQVVSPN